MAELKAQPDKRTTRQKHFDEMYAAFFAYYQAALLKEPPPHEKVRLQLTTVFFDDLDLLKTLRPIFESGVSNVDEKRAAARAAYLDAITIHNRTAGLAWQPVKESEKRGL